MPKMLQACAKGVVLYGNETWALKEEIREKWNDDSGCVM